MINKFILELLTVIYSITSHSRAKMVTSTEVRVTKKSRIDKTPTPDFLIGARYISVNIIDTGYAYEKTINNQLAKTGFTPDFEAEKPKGMHYDPECKNGMVLLKDSDPSIAYIRYYIDLTIKSKSDGEYVDRDGKIITHLITKKIRGEYFNGYTAEGVKTGGSFKQASHGVSKEVKPRSVFASGVLYFQKGDAIFNTALAKNKKVMDLLDLELV